MSVSTLTVSVVGTTSLALTYANGYEVNAEGLGPGPRTYRRETVTSPYVRGRFLVDRQLDTHDATLDVWVYGSGASQLATRIATLLTAFDQLTYNLQVVIDGVTYEWKCEPADAAVGNGGVFDFWDLGAFQQVVHLIIPRDPLPVAGPL